MDYKTLNALPAETFLDPSRFTTPLDNEKTSKEQYANGLDIGRNSVCVGVGMMGTWFASLKNGGSLTSYEGIGYHSNTATLLRGFLDSGVKVVIHRWDNEKKIVVETVIKESVA